MKSNLKPLSIILFLACLLSCNHSLDIESFIDDSSAFTIGEMSDTLSFARPQQIPVNSAQWKMLSDWLTSNKTGWNSSVASYIGDLWVRQAKLTLLVSDNFVVLTLIEDNGQARQYTKSVSTNDLEFLTSKSR